MKIALWTLFIAFAIPAVYMKHYTNIDVNSSDLYFLLVLGSLITFTIAITHGLYGEDEN